MTTTIYQRWQRKPDAGPDHAAIWVLCTERGEPVYATGTKTDIQCATLDRIPFCIKPTALKAHYAPAPKVLE